MQTRLERRGKKLETRPPKTGGSLKRSFWGQKRTGSGKKAPVQTSPNSFWSWNSSRLSSKELKPVGGGQQEIRRVVLSLRPLTAGRTRHMRLKEKGRKNRKSTATIKRRESLTISQIFPFQGGTKTSSKRGKRKKHLSVTKSSAGSFWAVPHKRQ